MNQGVSLPPLLEEREYSYSEYLQDIRSLDITCDNGLRLVIDNLNRCYREAVRVSADELLTFGETQSKFEVINQYNNFITSVTNLESFYNFLINNAQPRALQRLGPFSIEGQNISLYQEIVTRSSNIKDYLEQIYDKSEDNVVETIVQYRDFILDNIPQSIPIQIISEKQCNEITRDALQNIKDCKNDHLILRYSQVVRSFNNYLASAAKEDIDDALDNRDELIEYLQLIRDTLISELIVRDYNSYYVISQGRVPDEGHLRYRNSLVPLIKDVNEWLFEIPETTFFPSYHIISFYDTLDKYYQKIVETRHRTLVSPIPSTLRSPVNPAFQGEEF